MIVTVIVKIPVVNEKGNGDREKVAVGKLQFLSIDWSNECGGGGIASGIVKLLQTGLQ